MSPLGMALINAIINGKLGNMNNFVINHTVGPFLVNAPANGSPITFLRESDLSATGDSANTSSGIPRSNSAMAFDQSTSPALTGTFNVSGVSGSIQAKPVFQLSVRKSRILLLKQRRHTLTSLLMSSLLSPTTMQRGRPLR